MSPRQAAAQQPHARGDRLQPRDLHRAPAPVRDQLRRALGRLPDRRVPGLGDRDHGRVGDRPVAVQRGGVDAAVALAEDDERLLRERGDALGQRAPRR